jgi:hypothetical protein
MTQQQSKPTVDPGQQYGIIGLIMLVVGLPFIGIFLSIIGYKKSKKVGITNTLAKVGIWLNAVFMIVIGALIVGVVLVMSHMYSLASRQSETAKKTVAAVELLQKSPEFLQSNVVDSVNEYIAKGALPDGTKLIQTSTPDIGEVGYTKCESASGELTGVKLHYVEVKEDDDSGTTNTKTQIIGSCQQ